MYVDDVVIEPIPTCSQITDLAVKNIRKSKVELAYNPEAHTVGNTYLVQYSTDKTMKSGVVEQTFTEPVGNVITGLEPSTTYFVRVKHICADNDQAEWSNIIQFTTAQSILFTEGFDAPGNMPLLWNSASNARVDDVLDNNAVISYLSPGFEVWERDAETFASPTSESNVFLSNSGTPSVTRWLITPVIDLDGTANPLLSFYLALTMMDSPLAPSAAFLTSQDVKFVVMVSTDYGSTWKRENATFWDNTLTADYKFSEITNTLRRYEIDMAKYAGQAVQLAFCIEVQQTEVAAVFEFADIHIDNVRINSNVVKPLADDICEYTSYADNGFEIPYTDVEPGANEFSRYYQSPDASAADTTYNLTLAVNSVGFNRITDNVCSGDTYTEYGFSLTEGGEYKQKFSYSDRCDSVIILNLTKLNVPDEVIDTTICAGQRFVWSANGKTYTESTVETVTLKSTWCECDSTVTLALKVIEADVLKDTANLCFGGTYPFGGRELDKAGIYRDTTYSEAGCMSVTELTLVQLPDYRSEMTRYICEGETYTDDFFVGIPTAGDYTAKAKSAEGCDSTIVLHLIVLGGDTTYQDIEKFENELPYTIEGTDITYPAGTKPGTYIDTIEIAVGECSSILIHTLTVKPTETAVENVRVQRLVIVPNPVEPGNTATVTLELDTYGIDDAVVYIYNTYGALVDSFEPKYEPVTIECSYPSGVYLVRIVDASGREYQGKLIVQ